MGYNADYILGMVLGILIGVAVVFLLMKYVKKDGSVRCKYDERQELIRGRSFKYGYYTLILCVAVYVCFGELGDAFMERGVLAFLCMCVGISVQVGYAVWYDGYFSLNEYPKRAVLSFSALALFNFFVTAHSIYEGELVKNGILTFSSLNLFCGILLLVLILLILARSAYRARQDEG